MSMILKIKVIHLQLFLQQIKWQIKEMKNLVEMEK